MAESGIPRPVYAVEIPVRLQVVADEPILAWRHAIRIVDSQFPVREIDKSFRPSSVHETLTSRQARKAAAQQENRVQEEADNGKV
jgi:hypothetical protein